MDWEGRAREEVPPAWRERDMMVVRIRRRRVGDGMVEILC